MDSNGWKYLPTKGVLVFAVLYLVIIYGNSLQVPFLFDDRQNIVDRQDLQVTRLSPEAIVETFTRGGKIIRPLSYLSFALNYYVGGHAVSGYHAVNIAIHLIVTVFLYKTMLLFLYLGDNRLRQDQKVCVAGLATILWAAHPIQVTGVTYIVQRMTSLATMFYIIGLWGYLRGRMEMQAGKKGSPLRWLLPVLFAFLAGVCSKEIAILLPLGFILVELFFFKGLERAVRHPFAALCVGILMAAGILLLGVLFLGVNLKTAVSDSYALRPFTFEQRLLTEPRVLFFYVSQLFYPVAERFAMFHFIPLSESLLLPLTTSGAIGGILVAVILSFFPGSKYPLLGFPVLFFVVHHLLESSVFSLEIVYEHRNYLPSLFLFLPLSFFFFLFLDFYKPRSRWVWGAAVTFMTAVIFLLGLVTHGRNHDWRTVESFWKKELSATPELIRPYLGLGWYYTRPESRNLDMAAALFREGTTKKSYHNKFERADLWLNLARVYKQRRDFGKAGQLALTSRDLYQEKIDRFPFLANNTAVRKKFAEVYSVLAQISAHMDIGKALVYIDKSIALHHTARYDKKKGLLLMQAGRYSEALTVLQQSFQKAPGFWQVFLPLGQAMTASGYISRGYWYYRRYLRKALNTEPLFTPVYLYLAENRYLAGESAQGDQYLQQFLYLTPNHEVARVCKKMAGTHPDMVPFSQKEMMREKVKNFLCRGENTNFPDFAFIPEQ